MNDIKTAEKLFFDGVGFLDTHDFINAELRFREALKLAPASVPVLTNLAAALFARDKVTEALEFAKRAIANDANNIEAYLIIASCFAKKRHYAEVLASCDKIIELEPALVETYINRAAALIELNRPEESLASCDRAIAMASNLTNAHYSRGNALIRLGRYQEALASYDKSIAIKPDFAKAWIGRGNVFLELKRHAEAAAAYGQALSIDPDIEEAEGALLHMKMFSCDWNGFKGDCLRVMTGVRKGLPAASPFAILGISSAPADQLECAKCYAARVFPASDNPLWRNEIYSHDRIRVAYLSADFCQHPVSSLIVGMIECHDKFRFDVTALSFGPVDNTELRKRLEVSFEHFIDVKTYSDDQMAKLVRSLEIDILIDLMGFTTRSRSSIFALRPSPIQVNYLGYLATMGAPYMDYIVADRTVIPENQHDFYSEKIVYLPNSFQPTDEERRIADRIFTRAEAGLPQDGFVFCNFNNNYKITPDVFDIWMRILKQVDSSVLWLVGGSPAMERNLRSEAAARGVEAGRLVFAQRLPLPEYQARLRLADLFLDTLPYNAGATASDALWAGLPVLTRIGDTFVGRMAASVLIAIGLPELITTTPEAYERMALDLATQPEKLASIKRKLTENRLTAPLFDTKLYTKQIEAAYVAMYERSQAGLAPDHISIPN